jgi:hypothetical protein
MQKTWENLLGPSAENCEVDGPYISRRIGPTNYQVLHKCDDHRQSLEVMRAWQDELAQKRTVYTDRMTQAFVEQIQTSARNRARLGVFVAGLMLNKDTNMKNKIGKTYLRELLQTTGLFDRMSVQNEFHYLLERLTQAETCSVARLLELCLVYSHRAEHLPSLQALQAIGQNTLTS